ncbi:MAG: hypothetical protein ACJ8CR_09345 [Roseiflexaceae bacterium]
MSDFLSNLAARSLSLAPVVQPRPRSLFEAAPARGMLEPEPALEQYSIATTAPIEPSEQRDSTRTRATQAGTQQYMAEAGPPLVQRAQPPQAPLDHSWLEAQPALGLPQRAPQPQADRREAHDATALAPPRRPAPELAPEEARSTARPHKHRVVPEVAPAVVEHEQADRARVERPAPAEPPGVPTPREGETQSAARPIVTPIIERIVREAHADRTQPPHGGGAARPTLAPQPAAPEQQAAQPTIQVTIGRIEVRATPSATSTRRAPSAAPTLSLDEYLRSRQGGRR